MDRSRIMRTVVTALFTALVAAGAFIRIPMVPVPMTLQTFFALVARSADIHVWRRACSPARAYRWLPHRPRACRPCRFARHEDVVFDRDQRCGDSVCRRHERACISVRAAMAFGKSWSVVHRDHCGRTAAVHRGGCRQVCRDRRCRPVREGPCDGSRLKG